MSTITTPESGTEQLSGSEVAPAAPCSRVHGQLMFAGCDQHEHRSRTDLSCSKIRRVSDGKALTPKEVWEVLCENVKEQATLGNQGAGSEVEGGSE